jgi:hypothetical protein
MTHTGMREPGLPALSTLIINGWKGYTIPKKAAKLHPAPPLLDSPDHSDQAGPDSPPSVKFVVALPAKCPSTRTARRYQTGATPSILVVERDALSNEERILRGRPLSQDIPANADRHSGHLVEAAEELESEAVRLTDLILESRTSENQTILRGERRQLDREARRYREAARALRQPYSNLD